MILCSCVWFSPPQPPTIIDSRAIDMRSWWLIDGVSWCRMEIGASFCHVSSSIPDIRVAPWVTSGTHRWNGANPSFIVSAIRAMNDVMGFCV
jgi:hypothetical protein